MTTVYKIVDRRGNFSTGGYRPKWNNKGKTWHRTCDISNHIKNLGIVETGKYVSAGAKVVELKVDESPVKAMTITEWQRGMDDRKSARREGREVKTLQKTIQEKTQEVGTLRDRLQRILGKF